MREDLEAQVREARAESWIALPGRVDETEKIDLYRRAWVLASASAREGWGMTITEAAACGTPAVATRVPGHADAVVDGTTGLLADGPDEFRAGARSRAAGSGPALDAQRRGVGARNPVHVGSHGARHARSVGARRHRATRSAP